MQVGANGTVKAPAKDSRERHTEELVTQIAASQKALYVYIRSLIGPGSQVDDVLQEVNLVLWRKRHEFDGRGRFLGWACHIAYIQVLANRKKQQCERRVCFDEGILADLANRIADKVEVLDDRLEALRGCLAKLPPSQQQMILRRYEDGSSVHQVASELGRSAGSVRVTLHRIRKLLSGCIARTLAEGEEA
jgi:RNA polymerase sigma-70 factor, ECF subfamily